MTLFSENLAQWSCRQPKIDDVCRPDSRFDGIRLLVSQNNFRLHITFFFARKRKCNADLAFSVGISIFLVQLSAFRFEMDQQFRAVVLLPDQVVLVGRMVFNRLDVADHHFRRRLRRERKLIRKTHHRQVKQVNRIEFDQRRRPEEQVQIEGEIQFHPGRDTGIPTPIPTFR